jgi:hypothetical protein
VVSGRVSDPSPAAGPLDGQHGQPAGEHQAAARTPSEGMSQLGCPLPAGDQAAGDHPQDRPPWYRVQSAAWPPPLGGGAAAGLAGGLPAPAGPLPAPRRHPARVRAPGLRADLSQVPGRAESCAKFCVARPAPAARPALLRQPDAEDLGVTEPRETQPLPVSAPRPGHEVHHRLRRGLCCRGIRVLRAPVRAPQATPTPSDGSTPSGVRCWTGCAASDADSCSRCWPSTPITTTCTVRVLPWDRCRHLAWGFRCRHGGWEHRRARSPRWADP